MAGKFSSTAPASSQVGWKQLCLAGMWRIGQLHTRGCPAGLSLRKCVLAAGEEQLSSHYLSELLHLHPAGTYETAHCQGGFLLFHSRTAPAWSQSSLAPATRVQKQIKDFLVSFLLFSFLLLEADTQVCSLYRTEFCCWISSLILWVLFLTLHFNFLLAVSSDAHSCCLVYLTQCSTSLGMPQQEWKQVEETSTNSVLLCNHLSGFNYILFFRRAKLVCESLMSSAVQ